MSAAPVPVVIDTDPGLGEPGSDIDDGLAIALALRSPELDVRALTVVNGNVDAPTGVDVARRLAARLGRPELPVLLGATAPLARDMAPLRAMFERALPARPPAARPALVGPTHGEHAADALARIAAECEGELVVIAIGPMTNIALAIARHPEFATDVRQFVLMAGSATGYAQNVTVVGDFNTYADPEALAAVLAAGGDVRMVGIDQTSRVLFDRDDAAALRRGGGDFGVWAADCTDAWIDYLREAFPNRPEHRTACFLHDPLVVAAAVDPSLLTWERAHVAVETTSDLARGLVVADRGLALAPPGEPNALVATDVDLRRVHDLLLERIGAA